MLSIDARVVRIGPWVQNLGSKIIGRNFRDPCSVLKEAGAHDLPFKANNRKIGTSILELQKALSFQNLMHVCKLPVTRLPVQIRLLSLRHLL